MHVEARIQRKLDRIRAHREKKVPEVVYIRSGLKTVPINVYTHKEEKV